MATLCLKFNKEEVELIKQYGIKNDFSYNEVLTWLTTWVFENEQTSYEEIISESEVIISEIELKEI